MRLIGIAILFSLINSLDAFSSENGQGFDIKHLGVEAGLSQNQANAVVLDQEGFLWIGTWDGLNRYDGYDFTVFKPKPFDKKSISGNYITALFVDSKGRLWVGTENQGLNLYLAEDQNFLRIKSNPGKDENSLSNNAINKISEDSQGNIWVATDFGLNRLSLPAEDSIQIDTYFFHHFDDRNKINQINDILILDDGHMILASGEGLILFKPLDGWDFSFNRIEIAMRFPSTDFGQVLTLEQHEDLLLGGGPNGLFVFDLQHILSQNQPRSRISFTPHFRQITAFFFFNEITFIEKDDSDQIWVGTSGNGLHRFRDLEKPGYKIDFGSSTTGQDVMGYQCFLHDPKSSVYWVGTWIDGLKKITFTSKPFQNYFYKPGSSLSLANSSVFSISEDSQNRVWIGSLKGFSVLKPDGTMENFRELQSASEFSELTQVLIYSSLHDSRGNLWVGTQNGLFRVDSAGLQELNEDNFKEHTSKWPLTSEFARTSRPPEVFSIFESAEGDIWVGTGEGLLIIDPELRTTKKLTSPGIETSGIIAPELKSFYQDRSGQIWLSSVNGIHVARKEANGEYVFRNIKNDPNNPNSLCSNEVNSVFQDSKGDYWIATKLGLNKLFFEDQDPVFTYYGKNEGLPNQFIYSVLEDEEGKLWMSSNRGIVEFDPVKETFRNFDQRDGVQSNEFNQGAYLKAEDGEFYFGGLAGLTRFSPSDIKLNTNLPNTLITGVFEGGEPIRNLQQLKEGQEIELPYDHNDLQFSFVGLEFKNPEKNQYSYILEGLDERWTNVFSKKTVDYPALKPGNYTFKVISSNNDGVWNTVPAEVQLRIIPPFWQRPIFYVVSGSVFLIGIYLLYRNRVRKRLKYLMTVESIRQKENENVRKKAAADFHDEMGHYLTRINVLTELLKKRIDSESTELSNLAERIGDQSRGLYQGTRDFIWTFDPKTNNFFEVMVRIKDFGDDLFQDSPIRFHMMDLDPGWRGIQIPSDVCRQVVLLFKESMNNAAKHSKAENIFLNCFFDPVEEKWEISVEDDGVGLSESGKMDGQGFASMKKRATKVNLDFSIIERSPSGLKIIVRNSKSDKGKQKNIA